MIALGGNALGKSPGDQVQAVRRAAETIVELIAQGHEVIIGHGNGPQIGIINSAMDYAALNGPKIPYFPFAECGGMSQGYIGYHLQQALEEKIRQRGLDHAVISVVTQVLVDPEDPAFHHPTKAIGLFYTKEEAEGISRERGWTFAEDAGRGYRRVVPSPQPQAIVEQKAISRMLLSGCHLGKRRHAALKAL